MPKIINLQLKLGRVERFIVTLDDEQELVFTPESVAQFGIVPDKEFSEEEFLEILKQDQLRQAKDQAMRFLALRQHSRSELIRKMRERGYRSETINPALDELEKLDLVNDKDFAKIFIQNEIRLRPVGRMLLRQKLLERGIPADIFEPLLKTLYPAEQELQAAWQLSEKFQRTHSEENKRKLKEKLVRFLQGKGFTWEQIRQVMGLVPEE
jgi:regulatory protein